MTMTDTVSSVDEALGTILSELGPVVTTGAWTNEDYETQQSLRNTMFQLNELNSWFRSTFDGVIYKGEAHPDIEPIRAKSESENRPGRKPKVLTVEEQFAKRLAARSR